MFADPLRRRILIWSYVSHSIDNKSPLRGKALIRVWWPCFNFRGHTGTLKCSVRYILSQWMDFDKIYRDTLLEGCEELI